MALAQNISLSTADIIENCIQHATSEFSTVDTMGSMVGNLKFKEGYDDFARGSRTEKSYIWESLSAIAQDLGQTLYQNVRDYIDNVSNVDTCKVMALKSMMQLVRSDYKVLDKIRYYPVEIQNLIDILSISKKYLLNNQYIKKDFLDACVADNVLSLHTPESMLCVEAGSSGNGVSSSADYYQIVSDDSFYAYLSGVYANFIYDILTMHGTGLCSNVELYSTGFLSGMYGPDAYADDPYLSAKRDMNIDVNFNVKQIVNNIEVGIDSINNYSGDELSLLIREINYRRSPASGTLSLDLATRNMFYRKQKIVEYADFVDNMAFLPVNFSNYIEYMYDKDYLMLLSSAQNHACISSNGDHYSIVSSYVEYAAMSLAEITKYIAKIRDTIRLQTRKVFMKGTNNLLRFTANEFIIDYINTLKSSLPYEQISAFVQKLSSHSVDDIAIQEYWDLTEYMNLSTCTTKYAMNANLVNDRFFDSTFSRINGKLVPEESNVFTNEELNHFYLDDMSLANTLVPALSSTAHSSDLSSNFYEFLSTLFDVAANTAYYNDMQQFGMKLPRNVITEDINADVLSAKQISAFITSCAQSADFTFDGKSPISEQLQEFSQNVFNVVHASNREGISSTYDEYYPAVEQLSGQLDALANDFKTLIDQTYFSYFGKSSSIYCYDTDGTYKFDYFTCNDITYAMSAMSARDWINDDHCFTFALSTAIENLSSTYDRCYSQIESIINDDLYQLSFINPGSTDLDVQMNGITDFIKSKITERTSYLQSTLQNLRDQAAQAKQDHTSLQNTFTTTLASMPSLPHQNFYMKGTDSGAYRVVNSSEYEDENIVSRSIYDNVSQMLYYRKKSGNPGSFDKVDCSYFLDEIMVIDETASFEDQLSEALKAFDIIGDISFGANTSTTKTFGTQKTTIQSVQASIHKIKNVTLQSIVSQLKAVFDIDVNADELFGNKSCIEQIESLIAFLNNDVTDQQFNRDSAMKSYYQILSKVNDISCNEYISAKSQYEALWTEFESFFADYAKGSDYRLYVPHNMASISEYRQKKDVVALQQINSALDQFDARYAALIQQFSDMCQQSTIKLYGYDNKLHQYIYNGNALEDSLADFTGKLLTDIDVKDLLAIDAANEVNEQIQRSVNNVEYLYKTYFPYAIQYEDSVEYSEKFNALQISFADIISQINDKLEYTNEYEYVYSKELFRNYSGVQELATDPYYNLKNQTHPSYQIHPFMWNFIERHVFDTALEHISKDVVSLTYDILESANASSYIDSMLGKFGNVINVWRTNQLDFTGYSTTYEQSNHICQYTGQWSEVVGYDGAFYPPALDGYIADPSLDSLSAYYKHLKLDEDMHMKSIIAEAFASSYEQIKTITAEADLSAVHDIYKYYTDSYGNIYILYKKYDVENPSEQAKLNTPGQLWIRLADSPLAFPLSSIVDMDSSSRTLANMNGIYDICMFDSGAKLVVTGNLVDSTTNASYTQSKALYVEYSLKGGCGIGTLRLVPTNMYASENYQTPEFPRHYSSSSLSWKYLGSLVRNSVIIDVVYIQCSNESGQIPDRPKLYIAEVRADSIKQRETQVELEQFSSSSVFPVIANHDEAENTNQETIKSYVDVMFTSRPEYSTTMSSSHKDLIVGQLSAANGYMYDDPIHESMNSLDLISDNLIVQSICVSDSIYNEQHTHQLQTNTDMGYIPSYPYGEHHNVLDLTDELGESYQTIELLGKSKNLDAIAEIVNPQPDPYITMNSLRDDYMYGRIYEDDGIQHIPGDATSVSSLDDYRYAYGEYYDGALTIFSNYSMYPNMPDQYIDSFVYNYVNGHYQWNIRLDQRFSYEKLRTLKLFIYSTTSLGMNPYVVADMSDVIDKSNALQVNEFLSTNYSASKYDVTSYSFRDSAFQMEVTGTQNGINQVDSYFSNHLPNIIDFTFKYATLGGGFYLKLDFKLKDINADGYIDNDTVKVVLADVNNISLYNWFHYLDPGVTIGDVSHALNKLSGIPLNTKDLLAIDFSNYNYLSDIQISGIQLFETNHRLQFKIGEDDRFSISSFNYYVPSLNLKYPLTFAQTFDKLYSVPEELIDSTINIYEPDEAFQLQVADADILSALNTLQMAYIDDVDDFRVYEEYYHVNSDDVGNNTRYSPDDSYFYQYVHFIADGNGVPSTDLSIVQSACIDVRIDGTDDFSIALNSLNVEPMQGERGSTKESFFRDFKFNDLDEAVKTGIIQHVKKFLQIHFGYQKSDDGITIYANYQNYIHSPYIKLNNGMPYMALLPSTYAKIGQDDVGTLDIVVQFRQYVNTMLMCVQNITVATCKIHNVSDDKPKFVLERLNLMN